MKKCSQKQAISLIDRIFEDDVSKFPLNYLSDIRHNLKNYEVIEVSNRIESKVLGKDEIPPVGKTIDYFDNDCVWNNESDQRCKKEYKEFYSKNAEALFDKIKDIRQNKKTGKIDLVITRYLVLKK